MIIPGTTVTIFLWLINNTCLYRVAVNILHLLSRKSSAITFFWLVVLPPKLVAAIPNITSSLLPEYPQHPFPSTFLYIVLNRLDELAARIFFKIPEDITEIGIFCRTN